MENISSNKRIAKNTIVLYMRMIVVMAIGFYTARIVLQALGVEDYGLYNVVGGVVGFFTFLSISMTQCTQRFLNYEMAKPQGDVKTIFSISITVHLIIIVVLLLLAETIGLWFLNNYIKIPEGRYDAAFWVYPASVFSLIITVLAIPYNALVIAHERFNIFAVIGIVDALLKLLIAFAALKFNSDRLILYGILMMSITIVDFLFYYGYCRRKFPESGFNVVFDKVRIRELFSFTSWRMLGMTFAVFAHYGTNMLVNFFHSVTANAAMGIGSQVNQAVVSLTSNFQTAFTPQITKTYASEEHQQFNFLVFTTSKISFLLLFVVSLPIIYNMDFLLNVWLTEVPPYASIFAVLSLIEGIINAVSTPLDIAIMSSGKIKKYQLIYITICAVQILILYLLFYYGFPSYTAIAVKILVTAAVLFLRLYCSSKVAGIKANVYFLKVLIPIILVSVATAMIYFMLKSIHVAHIGTIIQTIVLTLVSLGLSYNICLNRDERVMLKNLVVKVIKRN